MEESVCRAVLVARKQCESRYLIIQILFVILTRFSLPCTEYVVLRQLAMFNEIADTLADPLMQCGFLISRDS